MGKNYETTQADTTLHLVCCFITLGEPYNNQQPRSVDVIVHDFMSQIIYTTENHDINITYQISWWTNAQTVIKN
jgi:hypothetical protein